MQEILIKFLIIRCKPTKETKKLMILKWLATEGIIEGIVWLVGARTQIINISITLHFYTTSCPTLSLPIMNQHIIVFVCFCGSPKVILCTFTIKLII